MKTLKILFLLVLTLTAMSCSKNDDGILTEPIQNPGPRNFGYQNSLINNELHDEGQTARPHIDWNGEAGVYSLVSNVPGVSVHPVTGVVTWNKSLPLWDTEIEIKATNSKGSVITSILFNHKFRGFFLGGFNHNPNSGNMTWMGVSFDFFEDGTVAVDDNGQAGTGTWEIQAADVIKVLYSYSPGLTYQADLEIGYDPYYGSMVVGYWKPENQSNYSGAMMMVQP